MGCSTRSAVVGAVSVLCLLGMVGCPSVPPVSISDAGPDGGGPDSGFDAGSVTDAGWVVTIDDSLGSGASTSLGVGTNQLFGVDGLTTPAPSAAARLNALSPSLVRMHIQAVAGNLPTSTSTITPCSVPTDTSCTRVPWSFTKLDYLVNDVRAAGAEPLMNIALPPPWQWTITNPNSTPVPTGYVTDAKDPGRPFGAFADYMRSLVEYYNVGSTTVTEMDGGIRTLTNPSGTANRITWWELLNEPPISSPANFYQPAGPRAYPYNPAFTPQEYASMWNTTTAAMRLADSTIKIAGPALPFVIGSGANSGDGGVDYIPLLLEQAVKPDAITFHGYAWVDNEITDLDGFKGDPASGTRRGLAGIIADLHQVQAWTAAAGVPSLPIWLDEFGFNGFGTLDPHGRPTHAYGAAWTAVAFSLFANEPHLAQMDEFSFALPSLSDLSLLNFFANRQPVLLYWVYQALARSFPAGSTVLPVQRAIGPFSLSEPGLGAYAVRGSDGSVSVLLSNATVASASDQGGLGVPVTVNLQIAGNTFQHVTLEALDTTTNLDSGPSPVTLAPGNTASITLPGYGVAIVHFAP